MAFRVLRQLRVRQFGRVLVHKNQMTLASRTLATTMALTATKKGKKLSNKDWMEKLKPDEYYVCREGGTEAPFTGKYNNHKETGNYVCFCCKKEVFSSETKFESGTGWPSFHDVLNDASEKPTVTTRTDTSYGMVRVEALCANCDAHLGHVFNDGPAPTGLRYCINSIALDFESKG